MIKNRFGKIFALVIFLMIVIAGFLPILVDSRITEIDIDEEIKSLMNQAKIPSISACIVKNDSVVWYKGYGFYNSFWRWKPNKNTVYDIGSITKAFTATALMQLYEQGLFDLDDDVSNYLPYTLRNPKYPDTKITFRMLLSHQSSLPLTWQKEWPRLAIAFILNYLMGKTTPSLKEYFVPGGCLYHPEVWTDNMPGDVFNYSNAGYMILAYLIEKLSGQTFESYIKEHIFEPLEMHNTSFHIGDFNRKQLAVPFLEKKIFHLYYFLIRFPMFNCEFGAGGIFSSIEDLSHFFIAHMNNGTYNGVRILENSSIKLMHTIQYPNKGYPELFITWPTNWYYGLGWMFMNESGTMLQGHGGDSFGFQARMFYNETDKTGIIFLLNRAMSKLEYMEITENLIQLFLLKAEEL